MHNNAFFSLSDITLNTIGLIISLILITGACTRKKEVPGPAASAIEILDEELRKVLNPEAGLEIIGEGFEWSEGPLWVEEHQFLLFSDVLTNIIYQWKEGQGVTEYLNPSGYTGAGGRGGELGSNGLMIDHDGNLVLCQHGDRRIAHMNAPVTAPAAEFVTLAGNYQGKKLNSPNDLVQHSNGDIYFTDPPYGLEEGMDDAKKELSFQGVYRLTSAGDLILLTDRLSRPNGIALSPDERTLYVANSDPGRAVWMAYELQEDGSIDNGRVFHNAGDFIGLDPGLPDGMTVDPDGYIYATGPGGVWVFAPDGRVLGKIKTGSATSNCTLGNGGETLYITADDRLLRISL